MVKAGLGRPGWLGVDIEAEAPGARRDYRVYCDPHKPKDFTVRASYSLGWGFSSLKFQAATGL